jgi:hypothetical protein
MENAYDVVKFAERDVGPPFASSDAMTWLKGHGCSLDEAVGCWGVEVGENTEYEHGELGDTIPYSSISHGEKISRPMGSKQAKRRMVSAESNVKIAAIASIADYQKRRLVESRRWNIISLMQSKDVPNSVLKVFLAKMATWFMALFDAGKFREKDISLTKEEEGAIHRMSAEAEEDYNRSYVNNV